METTPDWHFRRLTRPEWVALYHEHMERDFPPAELKPLEGLAILEEQGVTTLWGAYRGEALTGYYVLAQLPGDPALLLDYFAVLPQFRGRGCGGTILKHLRQALPEGQYLLIESEDPRYAAGPADRETRERRVAFYRRSGAALSSVTAQVFGVAYVLLTLDGSLSAGRCPAPTSCGVSAAPQRNGFGGGRRSSEINDLSRFARRGARGAFDDEVAADYQALYRRMLPEGLFRENVFVSVPPETA